MREKAFMRKIAVIFPGLGYTADRPLLYYAGKIAMAHGYERRALNFSSLRLTKDDLRDTIVLIQKGIQSGDNVAISFKSPAITLLKNGYSVKSPISTSLIYSTDMIVPKVEFFDEDGVSLGVVVSGEAVPDTLHVEPWISNMKVASEGGLHVGYDVSENNSGVARTAVMSLVVNAADGKIYTGCNVEAPSFLACCAERAASAERTLAIAFCFSI